MADENNQGAPAPADNATATQVDASSAAGTESAQQKPTNNSAPQVSAFDPRQGHESLLRELQEMKRSYGELRKTYTQTSQGHAALQKQIAEMAKALTEATRQEISPEDFIKSLQTQGVKAFDPLRQEWTKELQEKYDKALEERDSKFNSMQRDFVVFRMEHDTKNYPNFAELKPVMGEIAASENCPVDWNQDYSVIYETLYKLAKDRRSENAVLKAREMGRQEAEAQVAKEAGSAVAAGGKAGSITNPAEMKSAAEMRKFFVAQLGEAD